MSSYIKNHFVPVGYLKGFSKNGTHIHRFKPNSLPGRKYKLNAGLRSVGFKDYLMVIDNPMLFEIFQIEGDDKFIEKNCVKFLENNLGKFIDEITKQKVTQHNLFHLIDFMYISIIRNPKYIYQLDKNLTKSKFSNYLISQRIIFKKLLEQTGSRLKISDVENFILNSYSDENDTAAKFMMHVELLYFYFNIETNGRKIFRTNIRREIQIIEAVENEEFITSNFPASTHMYGLGFNNEYLMNASYFLPLNNRFFLSIIGPKTFSNTNKIQYSGRFDNLVRFLNYITFRGANGEVFSGNAQLLKKFEDNDYLKEMEKKFENLNSLISAEDWEKLNSK